MAGALVAFDAAVAAAPQDPNALVNRGRARGRLRDHAGAVADFTRALAVAPADWPQRAETERMLACATEQGR